MSPLPLMSPFRVASTPRLFLSRSLRDRWGGKRVAVRVGTWGNGSVLRRRGRAGRAGRTPSLKQRALFAPLARVSRRHAAVRDGAHALHQLVHCVLPTLVLGADTRILGYSFELSRIYPAISPLQYGHQGAARGPGAKPAAVRKSVPTPHRATLARPAPAVAADAASVAVAAASKAHDCDFSLSLQARPRKGVQRESAGHRRLRVAAPWRLLMRPRARHRTGRFPHRLWLSGPLARTPRAAGRQAAALTRPAAPVQPTTRHIDYCLHLIGMLQHYGVRPIAVLDGAPLPVRRLQSAGLVPRRRAAAYEPYVLSNIAGGGDGAPWPACWGSPLAHVSDSLDATRARLLCALTGEGRRQRGSFGDRRARS